MPSQPPIEYALGAPLQVRDRDDSEETVVGIRDRDGRWLELKRF